jgi:hypothetical protein
VEYFCTYLFKEAYENSESTVRPVEVMRLFNLHVRHHGSLGRGRLPGRRAKGGEPSIKTIQA